MGSPHQWSCANNFPTYPEHLRTKKTELKRKPPKICFPSHKKLPQDCTEAIAEDEIEEESKQKRICLPVSLDHAYSVPEATDIRERLQIALIRGDILQTKLRQQRVKTFRRNKKVASLREVVNELKEKQFLSEQGLDYLSDILPVSCQQLVKLSIHNAIESEISSKKYTPELRSYALTLAAFYSAKAYNYVRRTLKLGLPHPSTLHSWYGSIGGDPGFMLEAMDSLCWRAKCAEQLGKPLVCNLVKNEMAIEKIFRQEICWIHRPRHGNRHARRFLRPCW